MGELWIFIGALAVAYLVPGPDMILLLQTGASQGRARALATAIGLAAARAAHVALAGLGLAALLRTAPVAFDIVRVAGAAYLIWLGIGILRAPSLLPDESGGPADRPRSHASAVMRGLLTNLLNPKALLFCSVLLPQFIRPEHGSVGAQFLLLGAILVTVGIAFDVLYAFTGSTLGNWLARHRLAKLAQRWGFAALLIGFGTRLAIA
ncbi:LysE family translocator [Starkeya sp. ORNL1]|uniref:LysE family translocator n=1 Tax=Starkeya sp. ORNL1 TaxID=2709380 RepID=UPI001463641B|nr:LysE family translocator [Starkeya sp. ORNL1]QJP16471.1 LysE family translocator [Starkeya sp. ORNL1]